MSDKTERRLAEIERSIAALNSKFATLDNVVARLENAGLSGAAPAGNLQKTNANNQLATKELVHGEITKVLQAEIIPQLNNLRQYVHFQMVDGEEITTEYRNRVMENYDGPRDQKKLPAGPQTRAEFQNAHFVFRDNDL